MSTVSVSVQNFRDALPEFSNTTIYPDAFISRFLTESTMFMSTTNFRIRPEVRILCLEYLTAHLITLTKTDNAGVQTGIEDSNITKSASADGVSISIVEPLTRDVADQWFQTTPYGKKYLALLNANNPTPVMFLGSQRAFGIK